MFALAPLVARALWFVMLLSFAAGVAGGLALCKLPRPRVEITWAQP